MWGAHESTGVDEARRRLRRIATGSDLTEIVRAVRCAVPIAAGFVDTFVESAPEAAVMTPADMPADLVEAIMLTRVADTRLVYPLLTAVPLGRLVVDRDTRPNTGWDTVGGYGALGRWGLAQASGMRVVATGRGEVREHTYVALIREQREPAFSLEETNRIEMLWKDVAGAVQRARIPLTGNEPLLHQIVREQGMGMALLNHHGRVLGSNHLAHELAVRYAPFAGVTTNRGVLQSLLGTLASKRINAGAPMVVADPLHGGELHLWVHSLLADTHALSEDARLVLMRQFEPPRKQVPAGEALMGVTPRLREVARYLCETPFGQKQIADRMGISSGTLRKHVERLYRELGVGSRAELVQRLKKLTT